MGGFLFNFSYLLHVKYLYHERPNEL